MRLFPHFCIPRCFVKKYNRILIKFSGEALADESGFGLSSSNIALLTDQIEELWKEGIQIGVVLGGGNFWRGRQGTNMDRTTADHMGMLATVINALALQDALEQKGVPTRVQTSLTIVRVAEPYILRKALKHLDQGRVVIFAAGTGNPYFTTDTAAALRAAEIKADILLCAKSVDGVYDSAPKVNKNAVKIDRISYMDVIEKDLKAMDLTAISMCKENRIPVLVFDGHKKGSIVDAVNGKNIGTIIS